MHRRIWAAVAAALAGCVRGPPPPPDAACRAPERNKECFEGAPEAAALCCDSAAPPAACWRPPFSQRRCCHTTPMEPAACDHSDAAFVASVRRYYSTGVLTEDLRGLPSSRQLEALLRTEAADDEVERCPAASLLRMLLHAELLSARSGKDLEAAADLHALARVLQSAAVARGALSIAPSRDPGALVIDGLMRSRVAMGLHPGGADFIPTVLRNMDLRGTPCTSDLHRFQQCMLIEKSAGRDAMLILTLAAADPHSARIAERFGTPGLQVVVAGHLVKAAGPSAADHHLSLAASKLRALRARPEAKGSALRFSRALRDLQEAARNGTEHWYAEFHEEPKELTILRVLDRVGVRSKFYVEIGVGDGTQCNTRHLRLHHDWRGVLLDQVASDQEIGLHQRFLTASNINRIFDELNVPGDFDLLSIDVDDNDFWFWQALDDRYRPRVVIVEYVAAWGDADALNKYRAGGLSFAAYDMRHLGILGASLRALTNLAHSKGYRLADIYDKYDLIFVRDDLWPEQDEVRLPKKATTPAVAWLLAQGDFHTTSEDAIAAGRPLAVHHDWTPLCIWEHMKALCDGDLRSHCGAH